jgi:ribosome-binding ATPase YchF (GTP1/OBG family)
LTEPGAFVNLCRLQLLKQQTYFTAGVKEVRAWTINIDRLHHKQQELFI